MQKKFFVGIEYKHCIAYSKFVVDVINFILNPKYQEKYNIKFDSSTRHIYYKNTVDGEIRLGIKKDSFLDLTRVGNYDEYSTHCFEFYPENDSFLIDGAKREVLNFEDYSEEYYFQMSLIYNTCDLFYIILFNYLKEHCTESFCCFDVFIPSFIFGTFKEILDIAKEKEYYTDIIEAESLLLHRDSTEQLFDLGKSRAKYEC